MGGSVGVAVSDPFVWHDVGEIVANTGFSTVPLPMPMDTTSTALFLSMRSGNDKPIALLVRGKLSD